MFCIYAQNMTTSENVVLTGMADPGGETVQVGDVFTVAGVHTAVPNTRRKWWKPWEPRWLIGALQQYRVTGVK